MPTERALQQAIMQQYEKHCIKERVSIHRITGSSSSLLLIYYWWHHCVKPRCKVKSLLRSCQCRGGKCGATRPGVVGSKMTIRTTAVQLNDKDCLTYCEKKAGKQTRRTFVYKYSLQLCNSWQL